MAEKNPADKREQRVPIESKDSPKPVQQREVQNIIRIAETNLDGRKPVEAAIRGINGISFMLSNVITRKCGFYGRKLSQLSDREIKTLEEAITGLEKTDVPAWMFNRRKEPVTGRNRHLVASQLEFTKKMDINELKKMKCYRGVRHIQGLPVRGQRTRSSFRKGKTVGVKRKKEVPQTQSK